jgi:DHA1 family bicyclomycin/chloramphenicol resistance-like MFS transporter
VRTRQTIVFALAVTALFGILTSFIGTAEVVLDEVFGEKDLFPLIFGLLTAALAVGSLLSARFVLLIGLGRIVRLGAAYLAVVATALAVLAVVTDGTPQLVAFCLLLALVLGGCSVLVPNCNTAAMAPLAHVAGMGSAVLGTLTTAGGALLGTFTDGAFDGTVRPFALHVVAYAAVAAVAILVLAPNPGRATEEALAVEPVAV